MSQNQDPEQRDDKVTGDSTVTNNPDTDEGERCGREAREAAKDLLVPCLAEQERDIHCPYREQGMLYKFAHDQDPDSTKLLSPAEYERIARIVEPLRALRKRGAQATRSHTRHGIRRIACACRSDIE